MKPFDAFNYIWELQISEFGGTEPHCNVYYQLMNLYETTFSYARIDGGLWRDTAQPLHQILDDKLDETEKV